LIKPGVAMSYENTKIIEKKMQRRDLIWEAVSDGTAPEAAIASGIGIADAPEPARPSGNHRQ
jgi:hypothetical protein